MAHTGSKGRKPGAKGITASALRAQAVPYFRMGWEPERIAPLFGKSVETIRKWRRHPDVVKALGEIAEHVVEATKDEAAGLVSLAWSTLRTAMESAEDDRVRVDAAKTVLSRCGYPEGTKSETKHTAEGTGVVLFGSIEMAARIARGGEDG